MSLFSRRIPYDRKRLLERASALASGWRWRRALALYRQVLAAEPHQAEIHGRVAPLLARSGRDFEAWESFRIAVEACLREGDDASARTLEQQAVRAMPRSPEAWRALARTELSRGRPQEAVRLLVEGSQRLARRRTRGAAIILLRDAREIDRWSPAVVLPLCRLLSRDGQAGEALFLLDHLEQKATGDAVYRAHALAFRIDPSLRHAWRYLRSALERRRSAPARGGLGRGLATRS